MTFELGFLILVLIVLLLIRFTHPNESVFTIDGFKVICAKSQEHGIYFIEYSYRSKCRRERYRTKTGRDRAYLSLNIDIVRKNLRAFGLYD